MQPPAQAGAALLTVEADSVEEAPDVHQLLPVVNLVLEGLGGVQVSLCRRKKERKREERGWPLHTLVVRQPGASPGSTTLGPRGSQAGNPPTYDVHVEVAGVAPGILQQHSRALRQRHVARGGHRQPGGHAARQAGGRGAAGAPHGRHIWVPLLQNILLLLNCILQATAASACAAAGGSKRMPAEATVGRGRES